MVADRLMLGILSALLLISFCISGMHDTLIWSCIVGLPALVVPAVFYVLRPGARITRCVVATAMMVFCALQIHQAGGITEVHFGIFVALAFLLFYRDWTVIVTAAAVVAVHHLSFNYLQEWGYGVLCRVLAWCCSTQAMWSLKQPC